MKTVKQFQRKIMEDYNISKDIKDIWFSKTSEGVSLHARYNNQPIKMENIISDIDSACIVNLYYYLIAESEEKTLEKRSTILCNNICISSNNFTNKLQIFYIAYLLDKLIYNNTTTKNNILIDDDSHTLFFNMDNKKIIPMILNYNFKQYVELLFDSGFDLKIEPINDSNSLINKKSKLNILEKLSCHDEINEKQPIDYEKNIDNKKEIKNTDSLGNELNNDDICLVQIPKFMIPGYPPKKDKVKKDNIGMTPYYIPVPIYPTPPINPYKSPFICDATPDKNFNLESCMMNVTSNNIRKCNTNDIIFNQKTIIICIYKDKMLLQRSNGRVVYIFKNDIKKDTSIFIIKLNK